MMDKHDWCGGGFWGPWSVLTPDWPPPGSGMVCRRTDQAAGRGKPASMWCSTDARATVGLLVCECGCAGWGGGAMTGVSLGGVNSEAAPEWLGCRACSTFGVRSALSGLHGVTVQCLPYLGSKPLCPCCTPIQTAPKATSMQICQDPSASAV